MSIPTLGENLERARADLGLAPPQTAAHPSPTKTRESVSAWKQSISIPRPAPNRSEHGIRCPDCSAPNSRTTDTRHIGGRTYRRRLCPNGHRFSTYEILKDDLASSDIHELLSELNDADRRFLMAAARHLLSRATETGDSTPNGVS